MISSLPKKEGACFPTIKGKIIGAEQFEVSKEGSFE